MSSREKPKSGSRFAGQLANLSGRPAPEEQPVAAAAQTGPVDDTVESFSSHMTRGRKRRLKMAAGREGVPIYEIVGKLVEDYLNKNHPDLK